MNRTSISLAVGFAGLVAFQGCSSSDNPTYTGGSGGAYAGGAGGTAGSSTGGTAGGAVGGAGGTAGGATGGTAGASTGGAAGAAGIDAGGAAGTAGSAAGGSAGSSQAADVSIQSSSLGDVLATATGLTLYVLTTDTAGTTPVSSCTTGCIETWPAFTTMPVVVPAALNVSDFTNFDRGGGVMQTAYMGWPIYTYVGDTSAGNVNGNGLGGVWFAVKIPFTAP